MKYAHHSQVKNAKLHSRIVALPETAGPSDVSQPRGVWILRTLFLNYELQEFLRPIKFNSGFLPEAVASVWDHWGWEGKGLRGGNLHLFEDVVNGGRRKLY